MRRVLPGDVAAVARVLCRLPPALRRDRLARLIADAEQADGHRRSTGRAHPTLGSGSLMAAASRLPRVPEPDFDDDLYCRCWILVLEALVRHRTKTAS
ncbi:MAG: hypothetical protein AAGG09_04935 [Pseudomonadota bacterium]